MTFFAKNFRKYLAVLNIIRTFAPAIKRYNVGAIAQLVEQRTENPCVPGSIPGGTTIKRSYSYKSDSFFVLMPQPIWQSKGLTLSINWPCVPGSIPGGTTIKRSYSYKSDSFFVVLTPRCCIDATAHLVEQRTGIIYKLDMPH